MRLPRFLTPRTVVGAHCDLPCGVYDPAQARIEAESIKGIAEKYQANTDAEFRTRKDRDSTVIAGSSMGGLISLYAFFRRPSPFGRALVMSPSIWFGGGEILRLMDSARTTRGRVYLDVGTAEGDGTLENARAAHRLLRRKGYRRDNLWYLESEGSTHSETDWAWRWPQALEFLLRDR